MGKTLVMHMDEAPWIYGAAPAPGEQVRYAEQLFGDLENGPWVHIITMMEPGYAADVHCHSQDEVIYIMEGEMILNGQSHRPGTVIFMEKETDYGFTVGPEGVRFMEMRPGRAQYRRQGGEWGVFVDH
jgi:hypothetical protein